MASVGAEAIFIIGENKRRLEMEEIKMWAQMFWEDGTVSQGIRFPAEWLDDPELNNISKMAKSILDDLNREEGHLLMWGAGNIFFGRYPISSESQGLETLASQS